MCSKSCNIKSIYKLSRAHQASLILAVSCVPYDIESESLRACNTCYSVFMRDDPGKQFLSACDTMVSSFPPIVAGRQILRLSKGIDIRKRLNTLRRLFAQVGIVSLPTGIKDDRRRISSKVVFSPVRPGEPVFLANKYSTPNLKAVFTQHLMPLSYLLLSHNDRIVEGVYALVSACEDFVQVQDMARSRPPFRIHRSRKHGNIYV